MTAVKDQMIERYLNRLEGAARILPRAERKELVAEIRSHLEQAVHPDSSDAQVRNLLEELGAPEDIVDAALPGRPREQRGGREVCAVLLLTFGMFLGGIGWFAGVALLLMSPIWKGWQKALGVLGAPIAIVTAGLASWAFLYSSNPSHCTSVDDNTTSCLATGRSGWEIFGPLSFLVVGFGVQAAISLYLYVAAGRQAPA